MIGACGPRIVIRVTAVMAGLRAKAVREGATVVRELPQIKALVGDRHLAG